MDVAGPLLVISEHIGDERPRRGSEDETRRVLIYDLAEDRYWTASDYQNPRTRIGSDGRHRSAVQPAGTSIIVWSGDQVRRMSLAGETEAVLFEDDSIRAIQVSPDATKVAVIYGTPGTVVVLDIHSGAELLLVDSYSAAIGTRLYGVVGLGHWRDDGSALSATVRDYSRNRSHTAVLGLDGDIRVLDEGLVVSPNLRYALRYGDSSFRCPRNHAPCWDSLTVLDVETGGVVWTVAEEGGLQSSPVYGLWFGPYVTLDYNATRLLDTATGDIVPMTPDLERQVEGPVVSTCGWDYSSWACYVQHEERVVWEGASGWTHYHGLIEPPVSLELRGIEPVAPVREVTPPPPPARAEMIGPLLAYEVHGEFEYRHGEGRPDAQPARRVIVLDEGTGRSWLAFTYRNRFAFWPGSAQPALGGFVADIERRLVYVALDGQTRTLHERWPRGFRVSPDGRKLAVYHHTFGEAWASGPSEVIVLDVPTGDRTSRLTGDEIVAAVGLDADADWSVSLSGAETWTADSARIVVAMLDWRGAREEPVGESLVVVTADGAANLLPCYPPACLSPDARYMARGRDGASQHPTYPTYRRWRSFDIIDFKTDRVLWTAPNPVLLDHDHWEWASATQFAWSSGRNKFTFDEYRFPLSRAEVSVLEVATGEVEVMDSAEYVARFHPPLRATTECPPRPTDPCRILLDGEVIGEGRWPRIIGFIELD